MEIYVVAVQWIGLALLASLISVRFGISIALVEIMVGAVAGNIWDVPTTQWIGFLASVGAVILTFLAGVDIDTKVLRDKLFETVSIGFLSFLLPFLGAFAWAYWVFDWDLQAAEIAGIALSTTSVAVVYAVMVETGLNRSELGKVILAACFVTDLGTVVALGALFTRPGVTLLVFVVGTTAALVVLPRFTRWFFRRYGERVSEPEIKYLLVVLFGLGALANLAGSEAVLPAYLAGLVLANTFQSREELARRLRSITFSLLTPFYFIRAGLLVSAGAVVSGFLAILLFLLVKVGAKFLGVLSLTRAFGYSARNGMYTTLLMSTGLTFGSISALYGLDNGLISQEQYSILVTVVIASAVVPTLIAQRFFQPHDDIASTPGPKQPQGLGRQRLALVGPLERLSHCPVVVVDKRQDFGLKFLHRGERASLEQLSHQDTQPNLDLVEPRTMLRRVVKHDSMRRIAQKRRPASAIFQDAALTLLAQLDFRKKTRLSGFLKRTSDSERWMLRLSTTKRQRVAVGSVATTPWTWAKKSASVRLGPHDGAIISPLTTSRLRMKARVP